MKLKLLQKMSAIGFALGCAVLVAMSGCATRSVDGEFPYVIDYVTYAANWGQFAPGDNIAITAVRGDRKHLEPGGRYLVTGTYTLSSMDSAKLGLSLTVRPDSPGAISPTTPEQSTKVTRGTGPFTLKAPMNYPGAFHVSFGPIGGGESISTIYFKGSPSIDWITGPRL